MKDISKKSKSDDFYQEIDAETRSDQTTSCISLIIFCMIIYALLIFTFWKISPWFWQLTNRASEIRSSIKIPSGNQALEDIKNKAKDAVDKTKENIQNQAQNRLGNEKDAVIDSTKKQAEDAVQKQNDSINQVLDAIQNQ